jgi:hypothetical protein
MKDLVKISDATGISVLDIKLALGVQLTPCAATTREQTWKIWEDSAHDSEEQAAAAQRYLELCTTTGQVKKALEYFGDVLERMARARLDALLLMQVNGATDVNGARIAYESCPEDSEVRIAAIRKIFDFFPE